MLFTPQYTLLPGHPSRFTVLKSRGENSSKDSNKAGNQRIKSHHPDVPSKTASPFADVYILHREPGADSLAWIFLSGR